MRLKNSKKKKNSKGEMRRRRQPAHRGGSTCAHLTATPCHGTPVSPSKEEESKPNAPRGWARPGPWVKRFHGAGRGEPGGPEDGPRALAGAPGGAATVACSPGCTAGLTRSRSLKTTAWLLSVQLRGRWHEHALAVGPTGLSSVVAGYGTLAGRQIALSLNFLFCKRGLIMSIP